LPRVSGYRCCFPLSGHSRCLSCESPFKPPCSVRSQHEKLCLRLCGSSWFAELRSPLRLAPSNPSASSDPAHASCSKAIPSMTAIVAAVPAGGDPYRHCLLEFFERLLIDVHNQWPLWTEPVSFVFDSERRS
jgi:hypothetical protein